MLNGIDSSLSLITIFYCLLTMRLGPFFSFFARVAPCRALWVITLSLLFLKTEAGIPSCGSSGRANFFPNGTDLYAAVRCYYEGFLCGYQNLPVDARGSNATVRAYYGDIMANWCTGEVTTFVTLFFYLSVSSHHGDYV